MDTNALFQSQSITIIEHLVNVDKLTLPQAINRWFGSNTFYEILRRKLTYISAMSAYFQLQLELEGSSDWMTSDFGEDD